MTSYDIKRVNRLSEGDMKGLHGLPIYEKMLRNRVVVPEMGANGWRRIKKWMDDNVKGLYHGSNDMICFEYENEMVAFVLAFDGEDAPVEPETKITLSGGGAGAGAGAGAHHGRFRL
jgi:hypothetical protein